MGGYSVKAFCNFRVWGLGVFTQFRALGIAALVVGPLHVHVTWPVKGGAW